MGCVGFSEKKRYKDSDSAWFNVISVKRGWVGVKFPEEKSVKQASKQANKQANKQASRQTSKQTSKQASE